MRLVPSRGLRMSASEHLPVPPSQRSLPAVSPDTIVPQAPRHRSALAGAPAEQGRSRALLSIYPASCAAAHVTTTTATTTSTSPPLAAAFPPLPDLPRSPQALDDVVPMSKPGLSPSEGALLPGLGRRGPHTPVSVRPPLSEC